MLETVVPRYCKGAAKPWHIPDLAERPIIREIEGGA
jgi:hypothetical protein